MVISKSKANKAGKSIISDPRDSEEYLYALSVVDEWRLLHQAPLEALFYALEAKTGSDNALISGRIKKIDTIIDKLKRPNTPSKLATMYDIAGCRLVVEDLSDLSAIGSVLATLPEYDIEKSLNHDYVSQPRSSGYRATHQIFSYKIEVGNTSFKLFVELQIRTKLQHAWAVSVEMYDRISEGSRLKFNELDNIAARYFQLASEIISAYENKRCIPKELLDTFKTLDKAHSFTEHLRRVNSPYNLINEVTAPSSFYMVELDLWEQIIRVAGVERVMDYLKAEAKNSDGKDLLLIKGCDVESLERLYPNYFGNISTFTDFITSL